MEELVQELAAQNAAQAFALQAIVAAMEATNPGSREAIRRALDDIAGQVESDLLAGEIIHLIGEL